jgi:hypothetical protein
MWFPLARNWWRTVARFVPAHFEDPVGVARRVWRSGDPAARFSLGLAAAGVALTPLDLLLAPFDRRRLERAEPPRLPQLFVCGPPRSGTTLVFQSVIAALPVTCLTNLTALFPRAPLTAIRLWGTRPHPPRRFRSYYGRTESISGSSDALQLWDRWLGGDRTRPAARLAAGAAEEMTRFFGALEMLTGRPLVAKNNSLNVHAGLVAQALPDARFICLTRSPAELAQSLLQARRDLHGTERVGYGIIDGDLLGPIVDPIDHVCRQVAYYQRSMMAQRAAIGPDRFSVVSYEAFCADPSAVLRWAAVELFGRGLSAEERSRVPERFEASKRTRDSAELRSIERKLGELGLLEVDSPSSPRR